MEIIDYIDADEGREDATSSVAVNECENCGQTCERLTRVPEFNYMGCDDCMEEALAAIAREQDCEHANVRVEEFEDVNEESRRVRYFEEITCRDCGRELVETHNGDLVARKRKVA